MNKLFIGEITNFSTEMLETVFSETKVYFGRIGGQIVRKRNWLNLSQVSELSSCLTSYSIGEIIYFSSFLSDDKSQSDEAEQLDSILKQLLVVRNVKFLYVSGPDLNYETSSSRKILAESLEKICHYYASYHDMDIKILRSLHTEIVVEKRKERVHPDQRVTYVYPQDLLNLLDRILDSWDKSYEVLSVSSYFDVSYRELVSSLNVSPEDTVSLLDEKLPVQILGEIPRDLRQRFAWFPLVSVLENPPAHINIRPARMKKNFRQFSFANSRQQNTYITILQIIVLFLVAELAVRVLGNQVYFKFLDYRLLFVVMTGLLFGTLYGLFAALLASLALVVVYLSDGWTLSLLFFNVSNWLPFFGYVFAGSASGSIRERNQDELAIVKMDNDALRERLSNERQMADSLLKNQTELKDQIISSQDSYGRVYEIVKDISTPYLDVMFMQTVRHLSELFETADIDLYVATKPDQAYLVLAGDNSPRQRVLDLTHLEHALQKVENHDIWVNYRLNARYPMYVSALTASHRPTIYLLIHHLPSSKTNLHYQNIFRTFSNLLQIAYKQACELAGVSRRPFLSKKEFFDKLSIISNLEIAHFEYMLFRLGKKGEGEAIFQTVKTRNRVTDTFCEIDGYLYFLTHSHSTLSLKEWQHFFRHYQIDVEQIQDFEQFTMK